MVLTVDPETETAKPIYWPVWTSTTQVHPLGHEATLVRARELLQEHFREDAGLEGKKLIGVERTAQGWFPIFA
jgi:hypothetical protein